MPSRLANSWSDRARPVASSSNHARPRAIALISAGSHLELCFCGANPGRTNLVSAPRRVKAAVAVTLAESIRKTMVEAIDENPVFPQEVFFEAAAADSLDHRRDQTAEFP